MLVSAIMPVFNAENTVADAIFSVLMQSYQDWELIVVDDGSIDNTGTIVSCLAESDDRIRVFRQSNMGRGNARNRCLDEVRGDIVVICDGDDISFPERFSIHVDHFRSNPGLGISCSTRNIVFSDVSRTDEMYSVGFPSDAAAIRSKLEQGKMSINHPASGIARSVFDAFGRYDARLLRCQDYGFFRRVVSHVDVACTAVPLILYRAGPRYSTWAYFWSSKRYQWLADQFDQEALLERWESTPQGSRVSPGAVYLYKSLLRFVAHRLRLFRLRRRGLESADRIRLQDLAGRLNEFRLTRRSVVKSQQQVDEGGDSGAAKH